MTNDFKKALYEVNPYGQSSDGLHDVFNEGAWWAYRWFTKDKSVHFWASSCAAEIKKRKALQKQADALAEALETLIRGTKFDDYGNRDVDGLNDDVINKNNLREARNVLMKFKEGKDE